MTSIAKTLTGINGLDQITAGGFPKGRPTLLCGGPGCGKTLMSLEFIIHGAISYDEPGVFMAFEEKSEDLANNVASLGFDLKKLQKTNKVRVDHVYIERSEIEETGEYDLSGLFIRLEHAIDSIGAKRVVLDTIENLFAGLTNQGILRAELLRLLRWLKDKGVTAVITGERGEGSLTRQGLEEYVTDCVILLDHRVENQISTRRLRIIKYRGSQHGTNEYPFLIDNEGISVLPVTSLVLKRQVSSKRVASGISGLDEMLDGRGFYQGSSILVSGTAGTGKTSIASYIANAACLRKEKCMYFAFEESPQQIIRNMRSINLNLEKHVQDGLLFFQSSPPSIFGLEMHLVAIHKHIQKVKPKLVVIDPMSNLISVGSISEVKIMLTRLLDFLLAENITTVLTCLLPNNGNMEPAVDNITSLVDAWLMVRDIESNGERNRGLYVMKSRGMNHSNQVREFLITSSGIELVDVFLGPTGVLIGSARRDQQLSQLTDEALWNQRLGSKNREIERKKKVLEAKILNLQTEFESTEEDLNRLYDEELLRLQTIEHNRVRNLNARNKKIANGKGKNG